MSSAATTDLDQAARLIAEWRALGVYVQSRGPDRIRIGPPELLDDEMIESARAAKPALLLILTAPDETWSCSWCGRFRFGLPTICYWCRYAARRRVQA